MCTRGSCWSASLTAASVLWRDKLGQISLAVTTLFWGAGATLQFIVLKWAEQVLGLDLSRAAILQAIVAVGIAVGAVYAAASVSLKRSLGVLPVGIAMEPSSPFPRSTAGRSRRKDPWRSCGVR